MLLSFTARKGLLSYVVLHDGMVYRRSTVEIPFSSDRHRLYAAYNDGLVSAVKAMVEVYQEHPEFVDSIRGIDVETNIVKVARWLSLDPVRSGVSHELLTLYNKLPVAVDVRLVENRLLLLSNRYCSRRFLDTKRERAGLVSLL